MVGHGLPYDAPLDLDLNGDGVSLLMAYALGLDPHANLSGRRPAPVVNSDFLTLSFYAAAPASPTPSKPAPTCSPGRPTASRFPIPTSTTSAPPRARSTHPAVSDRPTGFGKRPAAPAGSALSHDPFSFCLPRM